MNIDFSTQAINNCSFGRYWNTIAVKNHDRPVSLAYSILNIMTMAPKGNDAICFKVKGETPLKMEHSIPVLLEYLTKPTVDIHVSKNYPKEIFQKIKDCLSAKSSQEARMISDQYIDGIMLANAERIRNMNRYKSWVV